jgi:hypothetical protein
MTTQIPQSALNTQQSWIGKLKSAIRQRIPDRRQIFPVFSMIVFFVFTWALYSLAYQVPSWLGYLSIWNVGTLVIYVLAFAVFESAVMLGFVLLICLVVPAHFFKEIFIAQGSAIVVVISGVALLMQYNFRVLYYLEFWQTIIFILLFLIVLAASVGLFASLIRRFNRLQSLLEALATRMMVFGYFYLTFGVLSLAVVLARIIF